ncbi:MAG: extracellular solute-binding protein [Butyrivibrio sp.]|nr:extracellular solute-binding protein [Butyrivibrio sp.]
MKKSVGILLAICIIALTCSCGSSTRQKSDSSGVTLTIAARDGSHTDVINAVKKTFEEENNCTVHVISLSADDIHKTVIEDVSNSPGRYDLIMIDDPLMPEYIEKRVLLNLTKLGYSDDDDFVEKSRLLGKDPYPLGATYSLPFSGNVQLLFYNDDLLKDPSALADWEDILKACEEIHKSGKNGYAIRGQAGNPIVSDFLPILWAFGGDLFDENNNVILDSKESREALEFYCKLYSTGGSYEKDDLVNAVSSGEAAVALGWPSWFTQGTEQKASIEQIPGKEDDDANTLATGEIGNWLLGVTSNSANPELSLKLAIYLTSRDVQIESVNHGGIPTRKSVFKDKDILSKYPYFDQIYSGTNNSRVRPRTTKWSRIEEVFGAELFKCIKGEQSVDETIEKSHKAIEELGME